MEKSIVGKLSERRSTALADYYLGVIAPEVDEGRSEHSKLNLSSLDDLYQYLLLDTQDTSLLETTKAAEAIAAVQTYISAILNGLERGHEQTPSKEELDKWHLRNCNISDWAGYKMLENHPENYINPTLRLKKTNAFQILEKSLAQTGLNDAFIQKALYDHLRKFEEICDLEMISGFIDGTEESSKQFKQAKYILLARQRVQPFGYLLRTVDVDLNADSTHLNPAAWSEWESSDIPAGPQVLAIRPVYFAAHTLLVWVEGYQSPTSVLDNGEQLIGAWHLEMKYARQGLDGRWAVPISLGKKDFTQLTEDSARLVALTYTGAREHVDDVLAVCFTTTEPSPTAGLLSGEDHRGWMFAALDAGFNERTPDTGSLKTLINVRFADQNALQHKIPSSESITLSEVLLPSSFVNTAEPTREGYLSHYLSLNLSLDSKDISAGGAPYFSHTLRVQGVCDIQRVEYELEEISFLIDELVNTVKTYFELSKVGRHGLKITCHHQAQSGFDFDLCLDNAKTDVLKTLLTVKAEEFTTTGFGVTVSKNVELLPEDMEWLWSRGQKSISTGAGFYVAYGPNLESEQNFWNKNNKLSVIKLHEEVPLSLKISDGSGDTLLAWEETLDLKGWFNTPWQTYTWEGGPLSKTFNVVWGDLNESVYGRNLYSLETRQPSSANVAPLLSKQTSGAQFLDMRPVEGVNFAWIRLNSTFGSHLSAKCAISIDELLRRPTQFIEEPAPQADQGNPKEPLNVKMDFNSAHGMFYWELFFYLPFLIGHRLCEEHRYLESQRWYHYIFNPLIREDQPEGGEGEKRYWPCRPLYEDGQISFVARNQVDPDAIARAAPVHYRKAVFMAYVGCVVSHADSLYRRETRDSLAAAKVQYVRARSLLGESPSASVMDYWVAKSVDEILRSSAPEAAGLLKKFSYSLDVNVANLPSRVEELPDTALLELDVFRPTANYVVLDQMAYIDQCLHNMRNDLTLQGKPMRLALYAPPTDPLQLLEAQAGGSSGASRSGGSSGIIPHYRFSYMLDVAKQAVRFLTEMGREVRQCMEQRDRGSLEELQHKHLIELSSFTSAIQREALLQQEVSLRSLKDSIKLTDTRMDHFAELLRVDIAPWEASALDDQMEARMAINRAGPYFVADGFLGSAPNMVIMGTAAGTGGMVLGGASRALGILSQGAGDASLISADKSATSAHYLRRREEWQLAHAQAQAELLVLETQHEAQHHAVNVARASLNQAAKTSAQAQEILSFYKTRATSSELYGLVLSQASTLFFQAYDVVSDLCRTVENCFQYETGNYDARIIRPNIWMDNYHGLGCGEVMAFDLLCLEKEYLNKNVRRQELTHTVSLRQRVEEGAFAGQTSWENIQNELLSSGKIHISFPQQMFDERHPGHYCRQIVSLGISIPAVVGPYQDINATLTQTSSTTAVKANASSLDYLYGDKSALPPSDVVLNLRGNQQVAINHGLDDPGLHQLTFGDPRYLPFEGTGAVSEWDLHFPRHTSTRQKALIQSMQDVIFHLRYLAIPGDSGYVDAVIDRLDPLASFESRSSNNQ